MFGKGLQLKTTALLNFFLWLVVFEKLANNRIVDYLEKCGLFSDFEIFLQLYLIELLGLLTGLRLLEMYISIYPRLLTGFGMLVFFTNLCLMEFQVKYLDLFLLSTVIDGFKWF